MAAKQVTCITKRGGHYNHHERIQAIGGGTILTPWRRSEDDAIRDVEMDPQSYYVAVGTNSAWVIVATHFGRKYLKTTADGYAPDNLLNLPECIK